MALVDNMYLFVTDESISYTMNVTTNPTEQGIDLTDHAEREPIEMSVTGMLLDSEKSSAYEQYTKLRNWQLACKQVKFVGRNVFTGVITDISKSNDYTVGNGAKVSLTLKEIRIANTPYQTSNKQYIVQKQVVLNSYAVKIEHIVRKGENLTLIAKKYGITVNDILKLNPNIKNPNLIYVNQLIRVK